MSASQQPHLSKPAAFRIMGHLDTYADHLRELAEAWPDRATQEACVKHDISEMKCEALALPHLIVPWMEFLLPHQRLLQAFARTESICDRLDLLESHIGLLLDFQAKCLEVISGHRAAATQH